MEQVDIAIVGATGLVGGAVMELLAERNFPAGNIYPLASDRSDGESADYGKRSLSVHPLSGFDFAQVQIAIFCVPAKVAGEFAPVATRSGCIVIDHSAAFREDTSVPLVQAEVNPDEIADYSGTNIIACPDSSTSHILLLLNALSGMHVQRAIIHAMRAVSDVGKAGIEELSGQSIALFNLKEIKHTQFPAQIAFNILPQVKTDIELTIDTERAIENQVKDLAGDTDINIDVTAVQVPVFFAHSYRLLIEFKVETDINDVSAALQNCSYISFTNATENSDRPTAVTDAAQNPQLFIDQNMIKTTNNGLLDLWMVADNLRCGVASNSVQIAEILVKDYL